MGKETLGENELMKLPIEVLYKILYNDYKKLLIEKGKNVSYIQELEEENFKLRKKFYDSFYNNSDELKQRIYDYKKSIIHTQTVQEINALKKDRDKYKNLYNKLLSINF